MTDKFLLITLLIILSACSTLQRTSKSWHIDTENEWQRALAASSELSLSEGKATPSAQKSHFSSKLYSFKEKHSARSITFKQTPTWLNWKPIPNLGPENLRDAPVLLTLGPKNYWIFGRHAPSEQQAFTAEEVEVSGFDIPLKTTAFKNQYDAPGGLKPSLGGYHAWQSRDMKTWIHHGPITEEFSRWVTTAEHADGKTYIYYDYPNDQDPHLYIDDDLSDGKPGTNMGLAFADPSDGSDCTFIRDLKGRFHIIYEDWSPINARKHSWDSPLAGHAMSRDGIKRFKILDPAVDHRTKATGEEAQYLHPHWKQHPEWDSNVAVYQVHKPKQHAYGDWASISIGGQYYLFCDYHPANDKIRVAWFTSSSLDEPFEFCGELGRGHPDPDICFAEGQFYLITQMTTDYVSSGPWVEKVEARVGADTNGDGTTDTWSHWHEVKEQYDYIPGFSKQIKRIPAQLDLSELPPALGFRFEFRTEQTSKSSVTPVIDSIQMVFAKSVKQQ